MKIELNEMESSDGLKWTNPASKVDEFAQVCEDLFVHVSESILVLRFGSSGATLPLFINRWRHPISHGARMHYSGRVFPDPVASLILSYKL